MLRRVISKDMAFLLASPSFACSLFAEEGIRCLTLIEVVVVVAMVVKFVRPTQAGKTIES